MRAVVVHSNCSSNVLTTTVMSWGGVQLLHNHSSDGKLFGSSGGSLKNNNHHWIMDISQTQQLSRTLYFYNICTWSGPFNEWKPRYSQLVNYTF